MAPRDVEEAQKSAVMRREAAQQLQQELRLSLAQNQSLPDMLITAPFAINLMGQMKLLAFSKHALLQKLTPPEKGFVYLRYPSLSSAIMQVVNQTSSAFDVASKNMHSIRRRSTLIFGRTSHAQEILSCLQDPHRAKTGLKDSMAKFRKEMENCGQLTRDTEKAFEILIETALEAYLAMTNESTNAENEAETLRQTVKNVQVEENFQKTALSDLETRARDSKQAFDDAKKTYQKEADRGEISAYFIGTMEDIKTSTVGMVNSFASVFHGRPTTIIRERGVSQQANTSASIDPALLAAEQIEARINQLDQLLKDDPLDIRAIVERGGGDVVFCRNRLETIKHSIGDYRSKHAATSVELLGEAMNICDSIMTFEASFRSKGPSDKDWDKAVRNWRKGMGQLMGSAIKLQASAWSQPGAGFGGNASGLGEIQADDSGTTKIFKNRAQKLMITKAVMQDCQDNLDRNRNRQMETQGKLMKLGQDIQNLKHQQATREQTRAILGKAIEAMAVLQAQVRQLAGFFNMLAGIINEVCMTHVDQYLDTIQKGIRGRSPGVFELAFSEAQANTLRETMILLRGHFGFVVKSTDIYLEIAASHINPCIQMAAMLPLSAGPEEQEAAKQKLAFTAEESAKAIRLLAEREMEAYNKEIEDRFSKIEEELKLLPPLENEDEVTKAIQEGVDESKYDMNDRLDAKSQLFDELSDNFY